MKLSMETINILKNFAGINSNFVADAGSEIKTISEAKNILAKATIREEFPSAFGIYDLSEFLSVLGLFTTPELSFTDSHIVIKEEGQRRQVKYSPSDREILTYPQKDINMPSADVEFVLTAANIADIKRAASTLGVSDIVISGDSISVCDLKNPSTNSYDINVDGIQLEDGQQIVFNIANLRMIAGDYKISVSDKLISQFEQTSGEATYWIALEKSSKL